MSLYEDWYEPCVIMEKKRVPDGAGGFYPTWTEGVEFQAAITPNTSNQAVVAERQGMTKIFSVITEKSAILDFHDVFRRKSDGKTFRVTSDGKDVQTPKRATFQFSQVTAEEWELTT